MKRTLPHALAALLLVAVDSSLAAETPAPARPTSESPSAPASASTSSSRSTPSAASTSAAKLEFEAFRLIAERNIFNPNRSARGDIVRAPRREPDRRVRSDSFSLLGTMSYEKGRFAFFDGSTSDYRKVLQTAGTIAGFKVIAVAPTCVRLESTNGPAIELCVGMRMTKREEDDQWQVSERPGTSDSTGTNGAAGSVESEEILKRMMERRSTEGAPAETAVAPVEPIPAPAAAEEKKGPAAADEADDVVRKLLQKREQELNK